MLNSSSPTPAQADETRAHTRPEIIKLREKGKGKSPGRGDRGFEDGRRNRAYRRRILIGYWALSDAAAQKPAQRNPINAPNDKQNV
jgi:hypothetical protein